MYCSKGMFTGLIEAVGRVEALQPSGAGCRLRLQTSLAGELVPGDSLAVNGVCLTVTIAAGAEVEADLGPETMRVTTLGALRTGDVVNLERPLRADGRFGGHFVQGHVDGLGVVRHVRRESEVCWLRIEFDPAAAVLLVPKGSIAVDGVSLTVAALEETWFEVMIIPFTQASTNLGHREIGERVNLEFDIVGKYVARAAELARIR